MKKNKLNTSIFVAGGMLAFFIFVVPAYSQMTSGFDLVGLRNASSTLAEAYDRIEVQQAWEKIIGSGVVLSEVIVGVVDTDIQTNHEEFQGVNMRQTTSSNRLIPASHGTAVMGIIGANNISSTSSANYRFPQMNGILSGATSNYVLGFRQISSGKPAEFGRLMNELVNGGAEIINLSLGLAREGAFTDSDIKQRLLGAGKLIDEDSFSHYKNFFDTYFTKRFGTLFVVSAGNQNTDRKSVV